LKIETNSIKFDKPLYLESGRILENYTIVYEIYGTINKQKDNIIIVPHALTGSHHAAGRYENEVKAGWWDKLIGDNKTLDTTKYAVICTNNIGSCYGSTGPMSINPATNEPYRLKFPVLTISDIVKAQKILFDKLEIFNVKAIIGGSLGGMQAICYAIEYPSFADIIIPLASTAYTRPWAIAINKIGIESIRNDKKFNNGFYDIEDIKKNGMKGLSTARMIGHVSFLNQSLMNEKFGRNYTQLDGLYELFGRFEIERYLEYNGENFSKYFDPLSYLYCLKTMNIFNAARGSDTLEDSFSNIKSQFHLISFSSDVLFFPNEMKEMYDIMCKLNKKDICSYYEVDTNIGHDAFLLEIDKFSQHIINILNKQEIY
jgi:homoserine O-acetyltransferase/O-succinyltransferase